MVDQGLLDRVEGLALGCEVVDGHDIGAVVVMDERVGDTFTGEPGASVPGIARLQT